MENLRNLIQTVVAAKAHYYELQNEYGSTCDRVRYKELKDLIADQTNVVYNAVKALQDCIHDELGIWPNDFHELCVSFGYCAGKNVRVKANVNLD